MTEEKSCDVILETVIADNEESLCNESLISAPQVCAESTAKKKNYLWMISVITILIVLFIDIIFCIIFSVLISEKESGVQTVSVESVEIWFFVLFILVFLVLFLVLLILLFYKKRLKKS